MKWRKIWQNTQSDRRDKTRAEHRDFIGPEGGFASEEIEQAMAHATQPITLGKRILRTETAGMTVLSILMYTLEGQELKA